MFGISFPELLVILFAMFLILGPERMAANAYRIGKWVSVLKRELTHIKETHLKDVDVSSFYDTKTELNKSLNELTQFKDAANSEKKTAEHEDKNKAP